MSQITYGSCLVRDQDLEWIDRQVDQLAPQLGQTDDDLPIFDIIVGKGKQPDMYTGSVAIFLPDATIHTHADSLSIDQAVRKSFTQAAAKAKEYMSVRQAKHAALRKIINKAKNIPMAV